MGVPFFGGEGVKKILPYYPYYDVLKVREEYKTDMRTAGYILAIERVAEALKMRGIYPR